ncbi:MAG: hypothetical protein ACRDWX_07515, partial [Acidimicrobiia bacterium]
VLVGALLLVHGLLYEVFPVDRTRAQPAELFVSDVAASLVHRPDHFEDQDLDYLATIAPLQVWRGRYQCHDSGPLIFHPAFDFGPLRARSGRFLALAAETLLEDPGTVLGHRLCAASYLFVPGNPQGTFFHRPPYEVPENDLGLERSPRSWRAFLLTEDIFVWAEQPSRLWLTWRPALPLWLAAATYAGLAARRLWPLLWPGGLLLFQLLNVVLTTTGQEFRFAFPIYLLSWLSLPLAWLVVRPAQARLGQEHLVVDR